MQKPNINQTHFQITLSLHHLSPPPTPLPPTHQTHFHRRPIRHNNSTNLQRNPGNRGPPSEKNLPPPCKTATAPASNHHHNHSTHHHATTIPTTKTHAKNLRWNPCRQPPRETHADPNPRNPRQIQTKTTANPQPNAGLHTIPKHRSLRQTSNADLHDRQQWVKPWCGGYGVLSLKKGSEWGLKGEKESEIKRWRERCETESGGERKW